MHRFSDKEVGQLLYPWGDIRTVEPRLFDRDARVAQYLSTLPRRAKKSWGWKESKFADDFVGVRGILTREEAEFWFAAGVAPERLDEDRNTTSMEREFAFDEAGIEKAFGEWLTAFVDRCGDLKVMSQAWLARILCDLLPPGRALAVLIEHVPERALPTFLENLLPPLPGELPAYREAGGDYLETIDYTSYQAQNIVKARRRSIAERLAPMLRDRDAADKLLDYYDREPPASASGSILHLMNAIEDDEAFLERFKKRVKEWGRRELVLLIGRKGEEGLEVVRDAIIRRRRDASEGLATALGMVDHPTAAEILVYLANSPTSGLAARKVLQEAQPAHVAGLLQVATGRSQRAELAEAILQEIRAEDPELIETAAAERDDIDADMVEMAAPEPVEIDLPDWPESAWPAWLEETARSRKPKGLPRFMTNDFIPVFMVDGGEFVLPKKAVYGLLEAARDFDRPPTVDDLGFVEEHDGRPVLTKFRDILDDEATAYAMRTVFDRWNQEGCPSKHDWCLRAMELFGDDAFTLDLARWIDEWPKHDLMGAAETGIDVLGELDSDTALMALNGLAQRGTFARVRRLAQHRLNRVAIDRSLGGDELRDMVVDDCGLDENGRMTFDYGTREFELVFDSDLKPRFRDEEGKVHRSLPRKRKSDDPAAAQGAKARYKLVKKRLSEVLKTQRRRLEVALIDGRRWNPQRWQMTHVEHPLMTHLTQRFLWGAFDDGNLDFAFRVDEGREFVDRDDEPLTDDAFEGLRIGLVHPMELGDAQAEAWAHLFADYEIVPPFDQLDRPVFARSEAGKQLEAMKEIEVEPGAVRGQTKRMGWDMGYPADGIAHYFTRHFPRCGIRAWMVLDPGLNAANWRLDKPQQLRDIVFTDATGKRTPDQVPTVSVNRVDPISWSEIIAMTQRIFSE